MPIKKIKSCLNSIRPTSHRLRRDSVHESLGEWFKPKCVDESSNKSKSASPSPSQTQGERTVMKHFMVAKFPFFFHPFLADSFLISVKCTRSTAPAKRYIEHYDNHKACLNNKHRRVDAESFMKSIMSPLLQQRELSWLAKYRSFLIFGSFWGEDWKPSSQASETITTDGWKNLMELLGGISGCRWEFYPPMEFKTLRRFQLEKIPSIHSCAVN